MPAADLVAGDVAEERRRGQQDERDQQLDGRAAGEDVDLLGGDEQPHREQQGVAGQEREEQAALDEDDHQAEPEQLAAEPVEEPVGVHPVHAQQEWSELHEQRPRKNPNREPQPDSGGSRSPPRIAVRRRRRSAGVACAR